MLRLPARRHRPLPRSGLLQGNARTSPFGLREESEISGPGTEREPGKRRRAKLREQQENEGKFAHPRCERSWGPQSARGRNCWGKELRDGWLIKAFSRTVKNRLATCLCHGALSLSRLDHAIAHCLHRVASVTYADSGGTASVRETRGVRWTKPRYNCKDKPGTAQLLCRASTGCVDINRNNHSTGLSLAIPAEPAT